MPPAEQKNVSNKAWQVFQEKLGHSGAVLERKKIGMPRDLESAKHVFVYRNTVEHRKNFRYTIEQIES